jgi:hypothetical protein
MLPTRAAALPPPGVGVAAENFSKSAQRSPHHGWTLFFGSRLIVAAPVDASEAIPFRVFDV